MNNYKLYRSTTSGNGFENITNIPSGTTSYLDKPDTPNTYYYVVSTYNIVGGESDYSTEANVTTPQRINLTLRFDNSIVPQIVLLLV